MPLLQNPKDRSLFVQTVQESVVDYLRNLILSGELSPGSHLRQDEIAAALGISRTPVREALHKLASEGLVTFSSYKGAAVPDFSTFHLNDIYTIRTALESYACYLSARLITTEELERLNGWMQQMGEAFTHHDFEKLIAAHQEFHATIYAAAGSPRLLELILRYLDQSKGYQRVALSMGRGSTDPIKEHIEILNSLGRHDPEAAARLMRAHLELTLQELLELFQEQANKSAN